MSEALANCVACGLDMLEGDKAWALSTHNLDLDTRTMSTVTDYQCEGCYILRLEPRVANLLLDGRRGYITAVKMVRDEMGWSLRESADWVKKIKASAS